MKSARRDYKKLATSLKSKIKKIIKKFRKGEIDISKLTDMVNRWRIPVDDYRIMIEKEKDKFFIVRIIQRKDAY